MPLNLDFLRQENFQSIISNISQNPLVIPSNGSGIEIELPNGKAVFKLNGITCWVIDVNLFAGNGILNSNRNTNGDVRIELRGARFPGTDLPADFICNIQRRIIGPLHRTAILMDFSMNLGGFHIQGLNLEHWLRGEVQAISDITINSRVCPIGSLGELIINGSAEARFSPNWLLHITSPGLANINGHDLSLESDGISLLLLKPIDPSLNLQTKSMRTLITILRDNHDWDLIPENRSLAIGMLSLQDNNLFDRIDIEAGEDNVDNVTRVLVSQSQSSDKLVLQLGGNLKDIDNNDFKLALRRPLYAIDFEEEQTALMSHFSQNPQWLSVEGFALQVNDFSDQPSFEIDTIGNHITNIRCEPALVQVAAPIEDDIVSQPIILNPYKKLGFVSSPGQSPGWGVLAAVTPDDTADQRRISLPDFAVSILRPKDLLSLEFLFYNMAFESGGGNPRRLVKINPNEGSFISVQFNAPQNITERSFIEYPAESLINPPIPALAAGPSRLVFQLATNINFLDYNLHNLLYWEQFDPSLVPVAMSHVDSEPMFPPHPPNKTETAIEAPWRLYISPNSNSGWRHSEISLTSEENITELWHTRLGIKKLDIHNGHILIDEQDTSTRKVRAIWSPDFTLGNPPSSSPAPFNMPLHAKDRDQIVTRSSNYSLNSLPTKAIDVNQLILSSLGAWMDVHGEWENNPDNTAFGLVGWNHRTTMARDNYVEIRNIGYLAPFGHKAVKITKTERKFQTDPDGNTVAYLRQREVIKVIEPIKNYDYLESIPPYHGRDFIYKSVQINTLITPDIEDIPGIGIIKVNFGTQGGPKPLLFQLVGTDCMGKLSNFMLPLVFVPSGYTPPNATNATNFYNTLDHNVRQADMQGQIISFAKPNPDLPGDTSMPTLKMNFMINVIPDHHPPFYPKLDDSPNTAAEVMIKSVQQLTGKSASAHVNLFEDYLSSSGLADNNSNKGKIFLKLVNEPITIKFSDKGDKSGGVATPDLNIMGLSQKFGVVSGTFDNSTIDAANISIKKSLTDFNDITKGFNPEDYFGNFIHTATVLGVIKLTELIKPIQDVANEAEEKIPKMMTKKLPDSIETSLQWIPEVKNVVDVDLARIEFDLYPDTPNNIDQHKNLELDVNVKIPIVIPPLGQPPTPQPPITTITGKLYKVKIIIAGVIEIKFNKVQFISKLGQKPDVKVDIGSVKFTGDLEFIDELKKYIPSTGLSDAPSIDITSNGVRISYSLAIPTIEIGVFSIQNLRFETSLDLSFVNEPLRFRLAFSDREHPFLVIVSMFGGGGFLSLTLGPNGIIVLEASIEFGGDISLSLVVASGSLQVMAGVYLNINKSNASELSGFLKVSGCAEALGIGISLMFRLGLSFFPDNPKKIAGEAIVTFEVHLLIVTKGFSIPFRREFSDPIVSFEDLMDQSDWIDYCNAFDI